MHMRASISLLAVGCATASSIAMAQTGLRTIPAQPRAQEEFVVVYREGHGSGPTRMMDSLAAVQPGRIDVQARVESGDFSAGSAYDVLTVATVPSAGSYAVSGVTAIVDWGSSDAGTSRPPSVKGSITVGAPLAGSAPRWRTLGGLFARPEEPGWGLHVAQGSSGGLFLTWYTYDEYNRTNGGNGAPSAWYFVSSGKWISSQEFRGVIYYPWGVPAGQPYEARHSLASTAGVATFRFIDEDHVEMSVEFAQASQYQTPRILTRYRF
jgi:hypothetical protein